MPLTIFVTAYDEYALRAFDVHAFDYLLKPFGRERFQEALAARPRAAGRGARGAAGAAAGLARAGRGQARSRCPIA